MTDLQMLGLNEGFSLDELKSAYRRKSKQYHPDTNQDKLNSHLAMIRLNLAYSNLLKKLEKLQKGVHDQKKDDGYSIYKQAIASFQSIHPSKWKTISPGGIFNAHAINTSPETPQIIQAVPLLLNI